MESEFLFTFYHADMENSGLFCITLHKHNCFTLRFMGVISTFCAPFRSLSEPTFSTLNNFSGNFASEILQTDFRSIFHFLQLKGTTYCGFSHLTTATCIPRPFPADPRSAGFFRETKKEPTCVGSLAPPMGIEPMILP